MIFPFQIWERDDLGSITGAISRMAADKSSGRSEAMPQSMIVLSGALRYRRGDFSFGSDAEDPSMSAAGPLYPTQRTNADASFNVCVGPTPDIRYGRSAHDSDSFSQYESRPRIGASSVVSYLSPRNRPARCLCGETSRDRLPAPSLRPCKMHVQMRPRPYTREIGRSLSAGVPLPPGARALAQCERADNTPSGTCPLRSRSAVAACAVPVRPPSPGQQRNLVRPSCAPTPEPSTRPYLHASEEEQSQ